MDYKELARGLSIISKYEKRREYNEINVGNVMEQASNAITDLLARAEEAEARAEKAERERDAAVKYIRHYGWCAGCKYFRGVRGCAGPGLKNCTEQNDHYEFGQKEE